MVNKFKMKDRVTVAFTVAMLTLGLTSCTEIVRTFDSDENPVNTTRGQVQPRLSYAIHDILKGHKKLHKETYKMVIGDNKNESKEKLQNLKDSRVLDSKSRVVDPTPERVSVAEDLVKFEYELEEHLRSFIRSEKFAKNDIIINGEYQLISEDGLLFLVNYKGETKSFLIPPTEDQMGSNLVGNSEIYESIVRPIENFFVINPDLLRENFDIVVGDGVKSDFTPPNDLKNDFKSFENMLEDNLENFLKRIGSRAIMDNEVLIKNHYQFHLEDGEWELVNYNGESIRPHMLYEDYKAIDSGFNRERYLKYNNFLKG